MQYILDDINDKRQFIADYLRNEQGSFNGQIQEMQEKLEDEISDKTYKTEEDNSVEISQLRSDFNTRRNRVVGDNMVAREILTKKLDNRKLELEKENAFEDQIQAAHKANMDELETDITEWEKMKNDEMLKSNTSFTLLKNQYALQIRAKEKAAVDKIAFDKIASDQAVAELEASKTAQRLAESKILERQSSTIPNLTSKTKDSSPEIIKIEKTTLETPLGSVELSEKDYKIYYFIIFMAFIIIIAILIYKNFRGARITRQLNEQFEKERITNLIYAAN